MKLIDSFKTRVFIALLFLLVSSCASTPKSSSDPVGARSLKDGISFLTRKLLNQAKEARGLMNFKSEVVAIQHFRVDTTGDFPKDHGKIEKIMLEVGKEFSMFNVKILSTGVKEDYLLTGFIYLKPFGYEIKASITDEEKSLVVGDSTISINNDKPIDTTPPVTGKDAVIGITGDLGVKKHEVLAGSKAGTHIPPGSINTDPCKQVNDAMKAFEAGDIEGAITHYNSALETKEGRRLDVCRNLYNLYERRDEKDNARTTFGKCVTIALEKNEKIELLPLLFEFDSTDFNKYKKEEYEMWVDEIGKAFSKENRCLEVVGYTSKSKRGSYSVSEQEYERNLSLRRAGAIEGILVNFSPSLSGKIRVIGKGFDECRSCAPDDEGGDIDRRVEFNVINCSEFQ
ncbi:MAG: hypothetical protein BWK78_04465 [Thiotrichaceae bacterium IS1]|nr:MAG: hypothetical protein BWK78_04465 [Thiotrichaceae bacterium IS1]